VQVSQEWLSRNFVLAALSEASKKEAFSKAASAALRVLQVSADDWVAVGASAHQDPIYLANLYQFRVDSDFYRGKSICGAIESINSFRQCRALVSNVYVQIGGVLVAMWIDESTESIVGLMVFEEV